jgi:hypothetical protein
MRKSNNSRRRNCGLQAESLMIPFPASSSDIVYCLTVLIMVLWSSQCNPSEPWTKSYRCPGSSESLLPLRQKSYCKKAGYVRTSRSAPKRFDRADTRSDLGPGLFSPERLVCVCAFDGSQCPDMRIAVIAASGPFLGPTRC